MAKETQGEIRRTPLNGPGGRRGLIDGCGCSMWDSTASARFPPAESPVMTI